MNAKVKTAAIAAVDRIFRDICGRRGIGDEMESVSTKIQEEMQEKWAAIIAEEVDKTSLQ